MERGATGGGGDRCAPLAPAAPKLTRLIRANSLTTNGIIYSIENGEKNRERVANLPS